MKDDWALTRLQLSLSLLSSVPAGLSLGDRSVYVCHRALLTAAIEVRRFISGFLRLDTRVNGSRGGGRHLNSACCRWLRKVTDNGGSSRCVLFCIGGRSETRALVLLRVKSEDI